MENTEKRLGNIEREMVRIDTKLCYIEQAISEVKTLLNKVVNNVHRAEISLAKLAAVGGGGGLVGGGLLYLIIELLRRP